MTIGELIKTTRKRAGMTQKQLAEKLGVSYVNISQLENDQRTPKYETVLSIAAALGVEWEELVPVNIQGDMIAAHVIEKAGLKLVRKKDKKVNQKPTTKVNGADGDTPAWNGDREEINQLRAVVCAIPSRFHNEIFQKLREIGISMEKIVRESKRGAFIGEGFIVDGLTPEEQIRVSNAINEVMFRYMPHQAPGEAVAAPQSPPAPQEGTDTTPPEESLESKETDG